MYSEIILDYFNRDVHTGECENPDVTARIEKAGNVIELQAKIADHKVEALKYRVLGPTVLIAICAYIAEQLTRNSVTEAKLLTSQKLIEFFELAQKDVSNALIAEDALNKLWENYNA